MIRWLMLFMQHLQYIERMLRVILQKEKQTMAEIDDLNTAIAAEDVGVQDITASVQKVSADVAAILAKLAAGTPPAALTAQIATVNAHVVAIKAATDILNAADLSANPPPPAP